MCRRTRRQSQAQTLMVPLAMGIAVALSDLLCSLLVIYGVIAASGGQGQSDSVASILD